MENAAFTFPRGSTVTELMQSELVAAPSVHSDRFVVSFLNELFCSSSARVRMLAFGRCLRMRRHEKLTRKVIATTDSRHIQKLR